MVKMKILEYEIKLRRISISEDFFNELVETKDGVKEALSKRDLIMLDHFNSDPDIEIEISKK